jgi:hypothetical protein
VREQDVAGPTTSRARNFHDSLGIGHYYIMDSHASTERAQIAGRPCSQFQLPMRAMVPVKTEGLLPGCKNAGLTHLTSAAYRMHPTEFQFGQAAAVMAAVSIKHGLEFGEMLELSPNPLNPSPAEKALRKVQHELLKAGTPIYWNFDAGWKHEDFIAVQFACVLGIIEPVGDKFLPGADFTRAAAAAAAYSMSSSKHRGVFNTRFNDVDISKNAELAEALSCLEDKNALSWLAGNKFEPESAITADEFSRTLATVTGMNVKSADSEKLTRGRAARLVFDYLSELYKLTK